MSAISIAWRYTAVMRPRQSLPLLWLLSDARNDAGLEDALKSLPRGSAFVFRHYHLDAAEREARFQALAAVARRFGHLAILSDQDTLARQWGADGVYGTVSLLGGEDGLLKIATAHDGEELSAAGRAHADAVFLSPVFPTRSHPDAEPLGIHGFHVLAQQSPVPVIALGGMTKARAAALQWPRWGAIDGLASPQDC